MAQDKQTSVKILQTQLKKNTSNSLKFFLGWGVFSISCIFICFFIFYKVTNNIEPNKPVEVNSDISFPEPLKESSNECCVTTPMSDDDLKVFLSHQPTQKKENKVRSNTPFDTLYNTHNKPQSNKHSNSEVDEKLNKKTQQSSVDHKEKPSVYVKPSLLNTVNISNELEILDSDPKKTSSLKNKDE